MLIPHLSFSLATPLLFHRMSGEFPFGNESPNLDNLNEAERSKPKKKGGRTKETNNARGIPESIRIQLVMTHRPKRQKIRGRTACKTFAGTGQSNGTNIKAFLTGSGLCSS